MSTIYMARRPRNRAPPPPPPLQPPQTSTTNLIKGKPRSETCGHAPLPQVQVVVEDFEGTTLLEMLNLQHVTKFISYDFGELYLNMVNWFYDHVEVGIATSVEAPVGRRVEFRVKTCHGRDLVYTDVELTNEFDLRSTGFFALKTNDWDDSWGGGNLVQASQRMNQVVDGNIVHPRQCGAAYYTYLSGTDRAFCKVIRECLTPTGNQDSRLPVKTMILLHKIRNGDPVHWPIMIAKHMHEAVNNNRGSAFPYAGLVCHIVKKWAIMNGEIQLEGHKLFNSFTLKLQDLYVVNEKLVAPHDVSRLSEEEYAIYSVLKGVRDTRKRKKTATSTSDAPVEEEDIDAYEADEDADEGMPVFPPRSSSTRPSTSDGRSSVNEQYAFLRQQNDSLRQEVTDLRTEVTELRDEHRRESSTIKKLLRRLCRKWDLSCSSGDEVAE